jgi:phosphonate degradation associated HDIG domain protein
MADVDELMALFTSKGQAQYGREAVSQLEHALQCAALAEAEGAAPMLVAAALLHDVGHLIAKPRADDGDDKHEDIGWGYLKTHFPTGVSEPVRLHVPAKRYLCATEAGYFGILSPASVRSLELQGGRFTPDEAQAYRDQPFALDAVRVRRWDDGAKVPGAPTKTIDDYAGLLRALSS